MVKLDVFPQDNKIREKQAKTIGFKFCLEVKNAGSAPSRSFNIQRGMHYFQREVLIQLLDFSGRSVGIREKYTLTLKKNKTKQNKQGIAHKNLLGQKTVFPQVIRIWPSALSFNLME